MTGMRIVCPAQFSWGSRVNWVLPTVLLCLIKLILGLILPCLAALLSCWAECGREGNGSHAQKLVLQTKPGGQLWWRRAEAAICLSACCCAASVPGIGLGANRTLSVIKQSADREPGCWVRKCQVCITASRSACWGRGYLLLMQFCVHALSPYLLVNSRLAVQNF